MPPAKKTPAPDLPILTVEQIVAVDDTKYATVNVPEWGGAIKLRSLSYGEQLNIAETVGDGGEYEPLILIASIAEPVLDAESAAALLGKAPGPVKRIVEAIDALNASDDHAVNEAEARFLAEPSDE